MIAVDTSALMAILLDDPHADDCASALEADNHPVISAVTVAEALIVAARRNVSEEMQQLIEELGFEVVNVTPASARRVAEAYGKWGKGMHSAGLNFGDCFAYQVAKEHQCRLLFVGNDFAQTDVSSAM
jgi:ribonuclease VapC